MSNVEWLMTYNTANASHHLGAVKSALLQVQDDLGDMKVSNDDPRWRALDDAMLFLSKAEYSIHSLTLEIKDKMEGVNDE